MPLVSELDVRAVLPTVRVPTLVVHHSDDRVHPAREGQVHRRAHTRREYVEVPGRNLYHIVEPWRRPSRRSPSSSPATRPTWPMIGFSPRCCSPTSWTRRAGRRRWATVTGMRLLDAHDAVVRSQLARFRGREVNTSGDGFLAMFDGPQRAIRCAMAIRDAVQALGIEVRAGLHTGECEVRGDDIGGIAVHIGARVSALAGPNDVLVSSTLRDLVIGSGLEFDDRGAYAAQGRARRVAPLRRRLLEGRWVVGCCVSATEACVVVSAFGGDGLAVLWARVWRRLGIITPRSPPARPPAARRSIAWRWVHTVSGTVAAARIGGVGVAGRRVQITVPSGSCRSRHPFARSRTFSEVVAPDTRRTLLNHKRYGFKQSRGLPSAYVGGSDSGSGTPSGLGPSSLPP